MPATFADLPPEVLFPILEEAARLNAIEADDEARPLDPYELTAVAEMEELYPDGWFDDMMRWAATDAIRKVNRTWHQWGLRYAIEILYVTTRPDGWRLLHEAAICGFDPPGPAVRPRVFRSLQQALELLSSPLFDAAWVQTVCLEGEWEGGADWEAGSDERMVELMKRCRNVRRVALSFDAIEFGSVDLWLSILGAPAMTWLQLHYFEAPYEVDHPPSVWPLRDPRVDFGRLRRLEVVGRRYDPSPKDGHLRDVARTATNLEWLTIAIGLNVTVKGLPELVRASHRTLQHLHAGTCLFDDPSVSRASPDHLCADIASCQGLTQLQLFMMTLCPQLFSAPVVQWAGEVYITTMDFCSPSGGSGATTQDLQDVLDAARSLIGPRKPEKGDLNIKIDIHGRVFEPALRTVSGDQQYKRSYWSGDRLIENKPKKFCVAEDDFCNLIESGGSELLPHSVY